MSILLFHALAGYLQHYETLLKKINAHPSGQSQDEPLGQYDVEQSALAAI